MLLSCRHEPVIPPPKLIYTYFVAGHTYGNRKDTALGFHPPFKAQFPLIQSSPGMKFGLLTGDMVLKSEPESWDKIDAEINQLNMPVYFVPGNHDVTDRALYESRYLNSGTAKTYYSFTYRNDLFLVLDANIDPWNISGAQLDYLKQQLNTAAFFDHIFIFTHQLIWWSGDNAFNHIIPNAPIASIPASLNYWTDVEPVLRSLSNPVFLFAGDLCANENATPYLYYKEDNIRYIAGGMGNYIADNILLVHIMNDGAIDFELIALQGELHRFGKLEDFILP